MATGLFNLKQVNQAISQGAWSGYIAPKWVEYLVVAGGGAGGGLLGSAGGGGGGGLLTGIVTVAAGTSYTVTVGAGGADTNPAAKGGSSVFGSISATGGGQGVAYGGFPTTGNNGGSGGGGPPNDAVYFIPGAGITGQGNSGGNGLNGGRAAGGGGGAGTVGLSGSISPAIGGNGGAGIASAITGTVVTYAGGGGGMANATGGTGGVGGGGSGGIFGTTSGVAGATNRGGGGGADGFGTLGASGGSGIVVVRYPGSVQFFTGGTLSYANGYIIHTFYANGTLAPTTPTPYVTDYQISRSLRFNSADTTYLNRTPATATNRRTWTWSGWVKKGIGARSLFTSYWANTDNGYFNIVFNSEALAIQTWAIDARVTTQVFRDPSAWYHIVVAVDTTQASNIDRIKIYVNGSQITAFTSTGTIAQNTELAVNYNGVHYIGSLTTTAALFNGYMTEVNFIDGQALTPSSFGYTNPATGVWSPLAFVGTYGTNGFYLNFSDNSNTTAATLGKDYSGNGNNWTPNNFSVTAGSGNDSLVDSPTSYGTDTGVGGTVRGNYATLNPLVVFGTSTFTNGNLDVSVSSLNTNILATIAIPTSGKWYWEYQITSIGGGGSPMGGIASTSSNSPAIFYRSNGDKLVDGTSSAYGATYTTTDIVGVAVNTDGGTITFYKNGSSQGAVTYATSSGSFFPALRSNAATDTFTVNFGQRAFANTAPSGFKALCTQNLPTPTIGATTATLANTFFAPALYTGNDGINTVTTGIDMATSGALVWIKNRSAAVGHILVNPVAGYNKYLQSNTTAAEDTFSFITATSSSGFTMNTGSSAVNGGAAAGGPFAYVAWNWKANGSGSTNTAGSITSTVSANTTSGFSVVTWTGNGADASIGHGLGVAPSMVIHKFRSAVSNWSVYTSTTGAGKRLKLNSTDAVATDGSFPTTPTSTVFYINGGSNDNGVTMLAYCFAPIAGFSAFGSYTGNSSTDGTFVYLGFRPAYMMIKATNAVEDWVIMDVARSPYNGVNLWLNAEDTSADATLSPPQFDFNSNGMKLRGTSSTVNATGTTYIYMAFASNPFKTSLAR